MATALISKKTRQEFREWLVVGLVLREIDNLFDNHDVKHLNLPPEQLPTGARRSRVEGYYASIDWTNTSDVRKILGVYEDILLDIPQEDYKKKDAFIALLKRDGYTYEDNRIVSASFRGDLIQAIRNASLDVKYLHIYIDRINVSVETDPALAIGSMKELLEATLKTILAGKGINVGSGDDIPQLLKAVQKGLELAPDDIEDAKRGSDTIRRTLSNLGQIVVGISELRNLYGTGHGHHAGYRGLGSRHARLVVGAGAALCIFLLETYEQRREEIKTEDREDVEGGGLIESIPLYRANIHPSY